MAYNHNNDDIISLDGDAYDSSYEARHYASQTLCSNIENIVPKKDA